MLNSTCIIITTILVILLYKIAFQVRDVLVLPMVFTLMTDFANHIINAKMGTVQHSPAQHKAICITITEQLDVKLMCHQGANVCCDKICLTEDISQFRMTKCRSLKDNVSQIRLYECLRIWPIYVEFYSKIDICFYTAKKSWYKYGICLEKANLVVHKNKMGINRKTLTSRKLLPTNHKV